MKVFMQSLLLSSVIMAASLAAQTQAPESSVDIKRLWLPKSYSQYWPNLRQVAEYQFAQQHCIELLRAELDRGQSSLDAPIFAVICRDENKKTFVEKFDGLSLMSLAPAPILPVDEVEAEVAVVDLLPIIYQRCRELWAADIVQMKEMVWLDDIENASATEQIEIPADDNLESTATVTQFKFVRRFNAKDAADNNLKYLANCTGSSLIDTHTELSIRRDQTVN